MPKSKNEYIDLLKKEKEQEQAAYLQEIYNHLGYEVINASTKTGEGLEQIKNILSNKTTLIAGHSGVGKSTIVNIIQPELNLKTGIQLRLKTILLNLVLNFC